MVAQEGGGVNRQPDGCFRWRSRPSCRLYGVSATPSDRLGRLRERIERWLEWTQRSLPTLIGVGLIVVLLLLARAGADNYSGLAELAEREAELELELEEARQRVESLKGRVAQLQDDPVVLERLAREELGLVRPGDTVVVLPRTDD